MRRIVLVGEDNPYGTDPRLALYHHPRGASGDRLREHLGLRDATYQALPRVNLCEGKWGTKVARESASRLLRMYDVIVACGAKVTAAFCQAAGWGRPLFFGVVRVDRYSLVSIPHPSGRCLLWNEPGTRERARAVLRIEAPDVPWGET